MKVLFAILGFALLVSPAPRAQTHVPEDRFRPDQLKNIRVEMARESWLRGLREPPEIILEALDLQDGDLIADIGAGYGYHSALIAPRVAPHGAVFAQDISTESLNVIQMRKEKTGVTNIHPVLRG